MPDRDVRVRLVGDDEALMYVLQTAAAAIAAVPVMSFVDQPRAATLLGFAAMSVAAFPFARRTWAAHLSAWQYFAGVIAGLIIGAGLDAVLR